MPGLLNNVGKIIPNDLSSTSQTQKTPVEGESFGDVLKRTLEEVNADQMEAQKAEVDLATGQIKDLHQAALAINKAELSMKMMLEVRNKAISAYKEILRTQM
ncbi:MAG: flagellar hook-basal body complex protein FliE [Campylobacterales bacterium]